MVKRAPKFDERYNANKYNTEVQYTFEFGVDDAVKSYLETGADGSSEYYHYSYWSNDNGEWCYVHHDTNGDYSAGVPLYECAEIGLRVDTPKPAKVKKAKPAKPVKLPKSAKMWVLSYENGASVGIFMMGERIWTARGNYVGAGRHQYFQAIEGTVRLLDYAKGEALAEYERIRAIDAAAMRAAAYDRMVDEESAREQAFQDAGQLRLI